jgi:hypothetical protein
MMRNESDWAKAQTYAAGCVECTLKSGPDMAKMLVPNLPDTPGWYWYYDPESLTMNMPGSEIPEIVQFDGDSFWYENLWTGKEDIESGFFMGPIIMPDWDHLK